MDLPILWFCLIAILWTGYFVLEGFDFGVGMLIKPFAKDEKERRTMLRTIGPVWDGNEVWLITAGGATFAAFPAWYATLFSGFYLPLFLILVALIVRICALEWRRKVNDDAWRTRWDWAHTFGAWVPAILWGVAFANFVQGMHIEVLNDRHELTGGFFSLLTPFTLLGGVMSALVFLTHGAVFIALKTDGDIRHRARTLASTLGLASFAVATVWILWAQLAHSPRVITWLPVLLVIGGLGAGLLANRAGREGWAFVLNALAIVGWVSFVFVSMFPNAMGSSLDPTQSLSLHDAAASTPTLTIMSVVALVFVPVVLAYQGWTYWVFRKRVMTDEIIGHEGIPVRSMLSSSRTGSTASRDGDAGDGSGAGGPSSPETT